MVSFSVNSSFSCSADGGGDITNENTWLTPTSDCTNLDYAIKREIKVTPEIKRDGLSINLDMWLNINSIDPELTDHDGFRYAITTNNNSCTEGVMASGSFKGVSDKDKVNLLNAQQYTRTSIIPDTYYLYLWLDGDKTPNDTQDKKFDFSLGGDCSDSKTLSNSVMALANTSDSGVYHETKQGGYTLIPADESAWSSVTKVNYFEDATAVFMAEPTMNDVWTITIEPYRDCFDEACEDYSWEATGGYMIIYPKQSTDYKVDINLNNVDFSISINDLSVPISEDMCTSYGEESEVGDGFIYSYSEEIMCELNLGNLTPEDKIQISASSVDLASGSGSLKFYQLDSNKVVDYGYRYEGKNVDNYIKFNDETWRIIGVEEGSTIGLQDGKRYTKIIRSESFENMGYACDYVLLDEILNGPYLNRTQLTERDGEGVFVYSDYTNVGLKEKSKSLIIKPIWHLYSSFNDVNVTTLESYVNERNNGYVNNYIVGLMSLSDYGYGALQKECADNKLETYNICVNNNWLYSGVNEWVAIQEGNNVGDQYLMISASGNINLSENGCGNGAANVSYRPVVYLNHNVLMLSGTGEIGSPYTVGYNE